MEGLEIIERIAIEQIPDLVLICVTFGAILVFLTPTFVTYVLAKDLGKALLAEAISAIIVVTGFFCLMSSGVLKQPTGEYKYKVRLTEDVSYTEFTEQYEVITENDDGTYIIKEK